MMRHGFRGLFVIAAAAIGAGCGGGGNGQAEPVPTAPLQADVTLLFMGNSHTLVNDVPTLVAALVQAAQPGRTVAYAVAPGSLFLDERIDHAASVELIRRQRWSAVVLQAQRYSSSGLFVYPTDGAEEWVRRARQAGAVPVLFPEWPRSGVDETLRIFSLHRSIAAATPACVPPIPQAFDIATEMRANFVLHANDGNHSSPAGALLAALVIAATITGQPPSASPTLGTLPVDNTTQALLREAAARAVTETSPWADCPGDRPR